MRIVKLPTRYLKYYSNMGSFRENLREELDYQDVSVKELSARTGISKRTLENYLSRRESVPTADCACAIAHALDVDVSWLVTGATASVITEDTPEGDSDDKLLADFHSLTPAQQHLFQVMLHAAAEDGRKK